MFTLFLVATGNGRIVRYIEDSIDISYGSITVEGAANDSFDSCSGSVKHIEGHGIANARPIKLEWAHVDVRADSPDFTGKQSRLFLPNSFSCIHRVWHIRVRCQGHREACKQ
jgi:hypothetical protein